MERNVFKPVGLPGWLIPPKQDTGKVFNEEMLTRVLFGIMHGKTIASMCREDPTLPDAAYVRQRLNRDPEMRKKYEEARDIGTDALEEEARDAARGEGEMGMYDVQRARLIADNNWRYIERTNPKRYGNNKSLDLNITFDIGEAMERGLSRIRDKRDNVKVIEHDDE